MRSQDLAADIQPEPQAARVGAPPIAPATPPAGSDPTSVADDAFDMLRRASQRENRKLREIAEDIVRRASERNSRAHA